MEVASLASSFAGKIGLHNAGELVGLVHDLGKYSTAFQNYLKSAVGYLEQDKDDDFIDPERMKGKIDHSTAGAQAIFREFKKRGQIDRIAGEILAVCICSHHSGLGWDQPKLAKSAKVAIGTVRRMESFEGSIQSHTGTLLRMQAARPQGDWGRVSSRIRRRAASAGYSASLSLRPPSQNK